MVVVSGISYIASFGISFSISPLIESQGYSGAGMEMACIILVVGLIGVPIAFWVCKISQQPSTSFVLLPSIHIIIFLLENWALT